jgi:hypothetical protein
MRRDSDCVRAPADGSFPSALRSLRSANRARGGRFIERACGGLRSGSRRHHEPATDATREALVRGQAENWDLAAYEIDELDEGFDDVIKFHPTHKDAPVAPRDAIPRIVTAPLAEVRAVIGRKDARAFGPAYDALTTACNNCHQAMNFSFNVVQRPATNPYPGQLFTPLHGSRTGSADACCTGTFRTARVRRSS